MYVRPISARLFSGMLMPAMRAMPYPCRCLCRGLLQITRIAPWRRMILHFSHIGLTDGRTFTASFRRLLRGGGARAYDSAQARPPNLARTPRALGGRGFAALGPGGEEPRAGRGDRDRELEMGRKRAVLTVDGPAVVAHPDGVPA